MPNNTIPDAMQSLARLSQPSPEGLFLKMPSQDYFASPGVSKSLLDKLDESPYALYLHLTRPDLHETSKEQAFGTLVDALIFDDCYDIARSWQVVPDGVNLNSREGKAVKADAQGRGLIKQEAVDRAICCKKAILSRPRLKEMVESGRKQASVFTDVVVGEGESAMPISTRCRPDLLPANSNLVVDLKTTRDNPSPSQWWYECRKWRYNVQASFYLECIKPHLPEREVFAHIVIESSAPFRVACFYFSDEDIAEGRAAYQANLVKLVQCIKANSWPDESELFKPLTRPGRAV